MASIRVEQLGKSFCTGIFRGLGKLVLFTVISAGFISYLPIGLMRQANVPFMAGAAAMTGLLCVCGVRLFYGGLRRYSSGNRMGLRQ